MRWGILLLATACGARLDDTPLGPDAAEADERPSEVVDAAVTVDTAPDARACEGNAAMASDGTCLVLVSTPANFLNAQIGCVSLGAQLAILSSAARDSTAKQLIGTRNVFIGLADLATEGTFAWRDGTPLTFTHFNAGEPNNAGGQFQEDCAIYNGTKGGWDDRPCSNAVPGRGTVPGEYAFLCSY